jgi:serine/threonine protein kinase
MKEEYVKQSALEEVMKEVEIMTQLDHPNVARLIEYNYAATAEFDTGESAPVFAMAMEICEGGELFDYIAETGRFTEEQARYYFHQL